MRYGNGFGSLDFNAGATVKTQSRHTKYNVGKDKSPSTTYWCLLKYRMARSGNSRCLVTLGMLLER